MRKIAILCGIVFELIFLGLGSGQAADAPYPRDPIRIVVTHAPGGVNDLAARLVQPYLQKYLGVPVVVENMAGAGGNIARAYVFAQKPDGYTLLISVQPSMQAGQIVTQAKFDTLKFVHIYNIVGHNYDVLIVPYDSPWKTVEDLKKASQAQALSSSGVGVGSNPYIFAMLLKTKAGINLTFVPFNSGAEIGLAVAGAQTQMGTATMTSVIHLHEQKKLRILATDGPTRHEAYPQFPTMVELGYPEIVLDQTVGIFAPPELPKEKSDILVAAFRKAVADKDFVAAAKKAGVPLRPLEPTEFLKVSKDFMELMKKMDPLLKPGRK
jgi:tripartite-type tricarboxylate transporter receptor subunit TctC